MGFVDFEEIKGTLGVFIINVIDENEIRRSQIHKDTIDMNKTITKITYDFGIHWHKLDKGKIHL